ncbi:MAG TPA: T9SS type A sorting domain-containing protein [Bacteroidota bacterium]|nr:T9SS type A sorting domain-containing protein [Bacteroidota bacterium]
MKQVVLCIVLLWVILPMVAHAQQRTALKKFLNPDGTLNTPQGFSGSLDAGGWRMRFSSGTGPRFSRIDQAITTPDPADTAWDDQFNLVSLNDWALAIAVDGPNTYIGGVFTTAGGAPANYILKWDGNTNTWSTLGSGMDGPILALAANGIEVYAAGIFSSAGGTSASNIAKWDGTSWSALGSGTNGNVYALAVHGTDVYAGGYFTSAGGTSATNIAKWDGTSWSALGAGLNDFVFAIAVEDTDIYAGGTFITSGFDTLNHIARWDGIKWRRLSYGLAFGDVYALAFLGSDLIAGGAFTHYWTAVGSQPARRIAQWNGAWSELGGGANNEVTALVSSGTDLYVGGKFDSLGVTRALHVAKRSGGTWSPLGAGTDNSVFCLGFNGDLFAGGIFLNAGNASTQRIAKWDGTAWSALGHGMNTYVRSLLSISDGAGGTITYAGGDFTSAGGVKASRIARWNGTGWSAMGTGMDARVSALAVNGSNLYAGGFFNVAGSDSAFSIAKWNGSSWSRLGSGISAGPVYAIATIGSDVYAAGDFPKLFYKWNGSSWSTPPGNIYGAGSALAVIGSDLYIAGDFYSDISGSPPKFVAKWDGAARSSLGLGTDGPVYALAVIGTDLYCGGLFSHAGGDTANNIARWDGTSWHPLGAGVNGVINAMGVGSDTSGGTYLYVTGQFTAAGGVAAYHIAKWDGGSWSAMGSGVGFQPLVLSANGRDVYAGGFFTDAGSKPSAYIAHWNQEPPSIPFRTGWNMVSIPMIVANDSVTALFPDASSTAFAFTPGGYEVRARIQHGLGYWLKSLSATSVAISGTFIHTDSIPVFSGWNLIGSIADPILASSMTSIPPNLTVSSLFGYSGAYVTTDSIQPGHAYWIKVDGDGQLVLSSSSATPANRIKIVPTSELPPSPPEAQSANAGAGTPVRYSLGQNFPNPFNPTTVIKFQLPVAGQVTLKIYNMLGREVATLVDGTRDAGVSSVTWDAGKFASGVYYYRIRANEFTETHKLVLLK